MILNHPLGRVVALFMLKHLKWIIMFEFYLDTNALWHLNRFPEKLIESSCTSHLALFEIISGTESEADFIKRKKCLSTIKTKRLHIIQESQKTILEKVYGVSNSNDINILAVNSMYELMLKSDTFEHFKATSILLKNKFQVSLETLQTSDSDMSRALIGLLARDFILAEGSYKDELNSIDLHGESGLTQLDMYAESLLMSFGQPYGKVSTEGAINNFRRGIFRPFIRGVCWQILNAAKGQPPGKNNIFDIGHLAYADYAKNFVSDDKIFKRIASCFDINLLSVQEIL